MKKLFAISSISLALLTAAPIVMANSFGMQLNGNMKMMGDDRGNANIDVRANATVDMPCMQAAVKQRDDAFISAYNAYSQSVASALKTREDAQVSAWAVVDVSQRSIALKASEKAFTSSYNDASHTLNKAKDDARETFKTAVRACVSGHSSSSSISSKSSRSSRSSKSSESSVACQNLTGTLNGTYILTNLIPDTGKTYNLTASGTVTAVGSVAASGSLHGVGFILNGQATGDVTLTHGSDTAVLHLVGPMQTGFSPLPTMFNYTVQSSTGVFAQMTTNGSVTVRMSGDTGGSIRLELHGACSQQHGNGHDENNNDR